MNIVRVRLVESENNLYVKRIYFYGDGYGDMSSRWFSVIDYGVKKVLFILMNDIHTKDMEKALIRML